MASLHQTYHNIADIINFKSDNTHLRNLIINENIEWDNIVKVASDHLVLTTVYCRLKQKSLLQFIPEDLNDYLTELTILNRNRNNTLLEEIKMISELLVNHDINHVFLKGAALISLGYYKDLGERMIADIDILVEESQIKKAKTLLNELGYHSGELLLSEKYQDKRHIPRLVNNEKLAAVEIHTRLLKKNHQQKLNSQDVLTNKRLCNGLCVPDNNNLFRHNVLGFHINDNGNYFNTIHFKTIYDFLIIMNCNNDENLKFIHNYKSYEKFLLYSSIYFDEIKAPSKKLKNKLLVWLFIQKSKYGSIRKTHDTLLKNLRHIALLINRLILFLRNSNYRKEILARAQMNKILALLLFW